MVYQENNMIKFRTIGQLLNLYVLPEIEKRIAEGNIEESELPLNVFQFRAIQKKISEDKAQPIVEINEEVNIIAEIKAKREINAGESINLGDIYPDQCYILPPVYEGKPAAYFLCQSTFFDYFLTFDCRPNFPDITKDFQKMKNIYPILDLINNKKFYDNIKPIEKIELISKNNWPPAPGYYPNVLLELHKDSTIIDSPGFLEIVSNAYGMSYWESRFTFWEETNFFPERLPYIKRAVNAHFTKDYIASICVLVPQFEGIIRDYLTECEQNIGGGFKDRLETLENLVYSRKVLMFPKQVFDTGFEYLKTGSFWDKSYRIKNPSTTINRHGIAHGIFTGFESEEVSLKYLILLDLLSYIILHDKMLTQNI